ncbi:hypothetical protein EON67_04100 [archaeon]|nr:MAG: hypothetical protein EON67_04100 [archaeon]
MPALTTPNRNEALAEVRRKAAAETAARTAAAAERLRRTAQEAAAAPRASAKKAPTTARRTSPSPAARRAVERSPVVVGDKRKAGVSVTGGAGAKSLVKSNAGKKTKAQYVARTHSTLALHCYAVH